MKIKTIIGIVVIGMVVGLSVYFILPKSGQNLGGYLVNTITNTSSSVGMADTLINSIGTNLQSLTITNLGNGDIDCGFNSTTTLAGTAAVVDTGLHINPTGSSTLTSVQISDPNLLNKAMHCVANTTSTVGIIKY